MIELQFISYMQENGGEKKADLTLEQAISDLYITLGLAHDKQIVKDREQSAIIKNNRQ